ncbi:MAG: hypothetical protein KatS3mg105_4502 [Gemmatales bacterium]|nr:MAG: hypothetical protein KatS3mg105_4502 [Gemmatales bacterium]
MGRYPMPDIISDIDVIQHIGRMPLRKSDANKGNFGRVLVVAGSVGMSGAAALCGTAALRSGAGLVRLAVPASILPMVAAFNPCYTTIPLAETTDGLLAEVAVVRVAELLVENDVIAAGPGLGRAAGVTSVIHALLASNRPLVLDADGLNAVQDEVNRLKRSAPVVITPHPGEFARLLQTTASDVQHHRIEFAVSFAREHNVVVVLKGQGTIVTDGRRLYHNTTGNPGMATGGTGDVLTGVIAGLVGQGMEPFTAAALGTRVHGLAGDMARNQVGEISLIASDLLNYLPRAFREY